MKTSYDLVVIGSGPGGYVAAIRAAQLGLDVACVEREALGGICLNWGCIPTKALLRSAEVLDTCRRASEFGVVAENVSHDFSAIIKRSRKVANRIQKGVAYLFKKNQITHVQGTGRLTSTRGQVRVDLGKGEQVELQAKHIILATGGRARSLPGVTIDGDRIMDYRKAMTLEEQPKSLLVVGAGAIGVEFASFYRSLGTAVTIVEFLPHLVPNEDEEISAELERAFSKRGMKLRLGHGVTEARVTESGVTVTIQPRDEKEEPQELEAERVLMAVGIAGNVEGIGLEEAGVETARGFVKVDGELTTSADGVYAIGDVIGRGLAHVASAEGVYLAERIAGLTPEPVPYDSIPACTYCHPEVASVGLTEEQAREQGLSMEVGKFPFRPLGRTLAASEYPGMVKLIWNAEDHALIGAHLIGPAVTELIAEPTLAKNTEVNAESLVHTVHAHPTFAEALKEAAEDALGHAIHI